MIPIIINGSFLAQPKTGVQRFAIEISKVLQELAPDIIIATPRNIAHNYGLQVVEVGKWQTHLWEQVELPLFAAKHQALLLNLDMRGPLLYSNKVITIHDLNFLDHPEWVSKKFYYAYKFLVAAGSKGSKKIITVSKFSKKEIIRFLGTGQEKIEVVYNAVSEKVKETDEYREQIVPGKYILSVASTDPRKNLPKLIEAFQKLNDAETKLVLVGLVHKREAIPETNDKVLFLGHVDDNTLINLYKYSHAFVYPSLYEGFGIPPLEAMYHKCPVVTSSSTSLPEICGDAAIYVDPEDTESITRGIERILGDKALRNQLVAKGQKQFSHFSWNQSAKKLLSILKETVENNN